MSRPNQPWIVHPSALVSGEGGPRRVPPRPLELREPNYLDKYDATTVFYDVFRCGRKVLAIGPPAGSLADEVRAAAVTSQSGAVSHFTAEPGFDRVGWFWAAVPRGGWDSTLTVESGLSPVPITVGDDLAGRFAGRRPIMTVSKDNDLDWVTYWARWYVERHGADAAVIYDNNTTRYSSEELWEALARVPGLEVAAVVDWPFRYGPLGDNPARLFDSNYAQHGALEHARWRLLRSAAGFLNVDIDELVIDPDGRSVFDAIAAAPSGAVELPGTWIYPAPDSPSERIPWHTDCYWVKMLPPDAPSPTKWGAVPSRLPASAQATTHKVRGIRMDPAPEFRFGHLLAISTNWYGGRRRFHVDPESYLPDPELKSRYDGEVASVGARADVRPAPRDYLRQLPSRAIFAVWRLRERLRAGNAR